MTGSAFEYRSPNAGRSFDMPDDLLGRLGEAEGAEQATTVHFADRDLAERYVAAHERGATALERMSRIADVIQVVAVGFEAMAPVLSQVIDAVKAVAAEVDTPNEGG